MVKFCQRIVQSTRENIIHPRKSKLLQFRELLYLQKKSEPTVTLLKRCNPDVELLNYHLLLLLLLLITPL